MKNRYRILSEILIGSLMLYFLIEWIARGSMIETYNFFIENPAVVLMNYIILIFILLLAIFFKKPKTMMLILSIPFIIVSGISNLITKFRGTPFIWSDIYTISEGLSLAPQYITLKHIIVILSVILIITMLIILIKKYEKISDIKKIHCIILYGMIAIISIDIFIQGTKLNILEEILWDNKIAYETNGIIYSFLNSFKMSLREEPDNYSKDTIEEIKKGLLHSESGDIINDYNLIILQLEGLMDPYVIEGVTFSSDPIPNYRRLYDKAIGGELYVPTFGGGTARSEIEVLSGINLDYLAPGEIPYNTGILQNRNIETIAHILKNQGYATTALHNFEGNFYNRHFNLPTLGFDKFISMEYMHGVDWSEGWPKDIVLLDYIKKQIEESEEKDFIYAIGVQTHGAFDDNYINIDSLINIENMEDIRTEEINQLQDYIDSLVQVDEFVNKVYEYIMQLEEPTILAVFSDHYPALELANKLEAEKKYALPYFIVGNRELPNERYNIEAYQLTSILLDIMGVDMGILPKFHHVFKNDDTYQQKLQLLQYDIIFGEQYSLIDRNYIKQKMRIGMKDIVINNMEVYGDGLVIYGEEFTPNSKIFIDGKYYETMYIDTNTLQVYNVPRKSRYVQVKQIGKNNVAITETEKLEIQ